MPAREPGEVHVQFFEAFNRGDLEALVALYEPESIWASPQGQISRGSKDIREHLAAGLALNRKFTHESQVVLQAGDIALLHCQSTITQVAADGTATTTSGKSIEVVRRQPDGTWLYVIDYPGVG